MIEQRETDAMMFFRTTQKGRIWLSLYRRMVKLLGNC